MQTPPQTTVCVCVCFWGGGVERCLAFLGEGEKSFGETVLGRGHSIICVTSENVEV